MQQYWAPLVRMASHGVGQNQQKKRKSNKQNHHQQKHASLYSLKERTEKDPVWLTFYKTKRAPQHQSLAPSLRALRARGWG